MVHGVSQKIKFVKNETGLPTASPPTGCTADDRPSISADASPFFSEAQTREGPHYFVEERRLIASNSTSISNNINNKASRTRRRTS